MAVIDDRPAAVPPTVRTRAGTGFRPAQRRRARLFLGVALGAVAIGGNVFVYSGLDRRTPVLQVVRDVPAGSLITADDLRSVDVGLDASVRSVDAADQGAVVGQYAKVRIVAGSLVVAEALQVQPLVGPDSAVVAIQVADGALPSGLRERSQVLLVVPSRSSVDDEPNVVTGRVVGLPSAPQASSGRLSLSVELDRGSVARIAASDDVRVVLIEPGDDTASILTGPGS